MGNNDLQEVLELMDKMIEDNKRSMASFSDAIGQLSTAIEIHKGAMERMINTQSDIKGMVEAHQKNAHGDGHDHGEPGDFLKIKGADYDGDKSPESIKERIGAIAERTSAKSFVESHRMEDDEKEQCCADCPDREEYYTSDGDYPLMNDIMREAEEEYQQSCNNRVRHQPKGIGMYTTDCPVTMTINIDGITINHFHVPQRGDCNCHSKEK